MELQPVMGALDVAEAHDISVVRPGRHDQRGRQRLPLDDQGVVARGVEGRRESGEQPGPVVVDRRRDSVKRAPRSAHVATLREGQRLMTETHAEDGRGGERGEGVEGESGAARVAGPGGEHDPVGGSPDELVHRDLIVADDAQPVVGEPPEELVKIVCK